MILLIDNYDSFSYNLYQLIGEMDSSIKVIRNNELSIKEIEELTPSSIIISPGPGKPKNAGICEAAIKYFAPKIPIMGICLGHQAICEVYGAKITYAKEIMHGKTSEIKLDISKKSIFKDMPEKITVGRYHSLIADIDTIPDELMITAKTEDNIVMAVQHRKYPIFGLQFHPESILTPMGKVIAKNFIEMVHQ
ncbi:MAG: aminodeoxychorismate/anthranilate synthase component II [Candidatus Gastranaerophilales bacterium]|nr:aminodeoxychorismate/anthranilate synthase component II [Candidatus Gastranaerophilales bacterium]